MWILKLHDWEKDTLGAGVRSLASVDYFVYLEVTGLGKRFVTNCATIRFIVGVVSDASTQAL